MPDYIQKLNIPRKLYEDEWKILNKMLSVDFDGKDAIADQLKTAEVICYCSCGCKTIDIQVDENMPSYEYEKRVPVGLKTISTDGVPIIASIHIVNGYICELEIYRADSEKIEEDIDLDNAIIDITI